MFFSFPCGVMRAAAGLAMCGLVSVCVCVCVCVCDCVCVIALCQGQGRAQTERRRRTPGEVQVKSLHIPRHTAD